jgi:NAD(P) transhydrogenase subunit alpha
MDLVPRITRAQSMDVLSSQSNLAGYRAVIEGANALNRAFPLMMTAAGTIAPARVLILGAGVAGLQAIATAKRLGAIVSAFDVREASREQVESLGATFVSVDYDEKGDGSGGYAKEMSDGFQKAQKAKLTEVLKTQDLVISTAQIPGKKAPVLIDDDMVAVMKPSSVIIDMATETGGNCTLSKEDKDVVHKNVLIMGPSNMPSHIPFDASQLFSRNVVTFLQTLNIKEGIKFEDDIIKAMCVTHDGDICLPQLKGE